MKIAEIFILIGVKGNSDTAKALNGVQKALGGVASDSLAAKAGVLAVIYGLERLTGMAAATGAGLAQFAGSTGLSTKYLQQLQGEARKFTVSGSEVEQTIRSIQKAMTAIQMNKGAPEGFARFAQAVQFDRNKINDMQYFMGKLQEFSHMVRPEVFQALTQSIGIGPGMVNVFRRSKENLANLKYSNIFGDGEIESLDRLSGKWQELWHNIQMITGRFASRHGNSLLGDLGHAVTQVDKLAKSFEKLAKASDTFKVILGSIAVLIAPLTATVVAIGTFLAKLEEHKKDKTGFWGLMNRNDLEKDIGKGAKDLWYHLFQKPDRNWSPGAVPTQKPVPQGDKTIKDQSMNLNINNYGVDGAEEATDGFAQIMRQAAAQMRTAEVS